MDAQKELEKDTVTLLRAVIKISSSLNDFDSIVFDSKYYKYKFKVESSKWCRLMLMHTDALMKSLIEEDDKLLVEVYSQIDSSTKNINAGTDEKTSLIVFYSKLKSALWDIEQMEENRNTFYPEFIYHNTKKLVTQIEKQFKSIIDIKDSKGNNTDYIVNYLNELGSAIMYYGKEKQ